jgi:hypothetical protein
MSTSQEWSDYYHLFRWEGATPQNPSGTHCPEWALFETEQSKALLLEKAQSYGVLPSISAFLRAFAALKQEGTIRQIRSVDPFKVAEPVVTKEIYERMSASEVRLRYAQDAEFRAGCDALIARGEI